MALLVSAHFHSGWRLADTYPIGEQKAGQDSIDADFVALSLRQTLHEMET